MTTTDTPTPKTYNLVTAAQKAGLTTSAIRYWILTGRLKASQKGTYWTITPEDLEQAMSNTKTQETPNGNGHELSETESDEGMGGDSEA